MQFALTQNPTGSSLLGNQTPAQRPAKRAKGKKVVPLKKKNGKARSKAKSKGTSPALQKFKSLFDVGAKIILVGALMYAGFHGYRFITTAPQFAVNDVVFSGNKALAQATIQPWADPIVGQNIFQLDLASLTDTISQNPWVHNVAVMRRIPQSIHILLEERQPYARIKLDKTYLMDPFGVLITADTGAHSDLPLITGVQALPYEMGKPITVDGLVPGLQAIHYMNRLELFKDDPIDHFRLDGNQLIFTSRQRQRTLRMGVHDIQEGFKNLKIFLNAVGPQAEGIHSIDLTFKDQVITHRSSSPAQGQRAPKT